MDNRLITFMIVAVAVCVGLLLANNFFTVFRNPVATTINTEDITKIGITHDKKEYFYTSQQQTFLMTLFKQAKAVDPATVAKEQGTPPDFEKVTIYRENGPNVEITPKMYIGNDLLFSAPAWNPDGLLQDTSHGVLKAFLSQPFKQEADQKSP